jgi:chemosensory pili system protein ChpA (sensor histidine kinase/response regulator)
LHQACAGYRRLLERVRDDAAPTTDDVHAAGVWPVLLLGHLDDPRDGQVAADLVTALIESRALADTDSAGLRTALSAVAVGIDPTTRLARKRITEAADVALELAADALPGVLAGMLQELPGRSADFSASVQRYVRAHSADDLARALRVAHTLKGDGSIVGLRGIANLTHALEEILSALAASPERANAQIDALLVDAADCLESMSDHVLGRAPPPERAIDELQRVYDCANALLDEADGGTVDESARVALAHGEEVDRDATAQDAALPADRSSQPRSADATATITIPMRLLDELRRLTGETIIRARQVDDRIVHIERHHADIRTHARAFQTLIAQLQQLVEVRGAALDTLRQAGALDDLELDRYNELHTVMLRLVEASADARTSIDELDDDVLDLRDRLSQQDRVQLDVREHVTRARQIAARDISPRLQRIVRQTSRQLEKPCELHIDGDGVPLDKDLVDALAEPLLHVLRNAVDHGLEAPAHRAALGKPATGRIALSYRRDAGWIVVLCRDDGGGLDAEAIRRRAIEHGLIAPDAEPGDAELAALVLRNGFSTRKAATLTSGRGIGLDIVHRRIVELKGSLDLRSRRGQGCDVEIRLPLSQVAADVLMVEAADAAVAVGLDGIRRVVASSDDDLSVRDGALRMTIDDATIGATRLETLLGFETSARGRRGERHALVVESTQGEPFAILVDAVGDARAVIVKNLGPHVPPNPGLLGATILGDGAIAPVVDLPQLLRRRASEASQPLSIVKEIPPAPSVLIVDDSLSARRSLEQLIGDAGFRVVTARDGLEALERIELERPDLLIVDLEMPRMNGLELASFVRKSEATRTVPIVMITSRSTERHRELARTAGVDVTLGKPYSEDGLLGLVANLLQSGRATA